jgi:sulfite reductase (NADPH) flavoprotein alpha-component
VADKPDYLPLVKEQYPEFQWGTSELYPALPIVYLPAPDITDRAMVIAEGKGFGGPLVVGVRAFREGPSARIKDVVVLSHKETPAYLQKLVRKGFFHQFIDKWVTDDFIHGHDVDGVSGATISSRGITQAMADALHLGAPEHLGVEKTWKEEQYEPGLNELLMLALFLTVLLIVYGPKKLARPLKLALPVATLVFVGFYVNASISLATLSGIVMGYVPGFQQHPIWWILVGGTLAGILLAGKNFYCGYMCPFDVVQKLLQKISGIKLALKPGMLRRSRMVIGTMTWFALVLIFLSRHPALGSYEPFSMMFSLEGIGVQWYILPFSLLGAFLVPQFWCRLFCPVGFTLSEAVRVRQAAVGRARRLVTRETNGRLPLAPPSRSAADTVTILFATQTGNSRRLAHQLQAAMAGNGLSATLQSMADYPVERLAEEHHLLIITSTHGEGDPPENAEKLHALLASGEAPQLDKLRFGVLGLGDSKYRYFCQAAIDFDTRLEALGGTRLLGRADCDVDYEDAAGAWIDEAVSVLQDHVEASCASTILPIMDYDPKGSHLFHKGRPFQARLLERRKLTGEGAVRDVYHVSLSLEYSGIRYRPGDLLGVWFENDPAEVDALLKCLSIEPDAVAEPEGKPVPVRQALIEQLELTRCQPAFVKHYAALTGNLSLAALAEDEEGLRTFTAARQVYDVVQDYPAELDARDLVAGLRRLTPRMYSIASCQETVGHEVHLTVSLVEYEAFGRKHSGGASGFLARRAEPDARIGVFVERNRNFRLPEDPDAPVIMIGPGTGIAPFRGFMQHRRTRGHGGDNWLIFGNPQRRNSFLYEEDWRAALDEGLLTRMDLAFSRDQAAKDYVQHRILEQGERFYRWLERGAHVYVCGDATRMVHDVQDAVLRVIREHGEMNGGQAERYLVRLRQENRFQKDVY